MQIIETEIKDVKVIQPDVFGDNRGYFFESYSESRYKDITGGVKFVQDNISRSVKSVVRGLHFQTGEFAQGKLCEVLKGKVMDVAVDIRKDSSTYGKHVAIELSEENHKLIWIPPGFAHGFSVLSKEAIFHYKCTNYYNKESERAIIYNDSDLNIDWKVEKPIVSEKDLQARSFKGMDF
ncbi:dTDP-4-dehydrorhamnose 3,5-epimerase [soil metagenome]